MRLRDQILEKVDVLGEYQAIGLRVAKGTTPNAQGWLSCHALGREDKNPSAAINVGPDLRWKGIYKDFGTGLAMGLFDAIGGHGNYADGRHAFNEIGRKYGVITGERKKGKSDKGTPPTLADVEKFKQNLSPEAIQDLKDKRGLTVESIAKYEIGWDTSRKRYTFPVYEPDSIGKRLVNIRMHNSKQTPKTLSWSGFGETRLYGLDRLVKAARGTTINITEGEFDCMLAEQETGMISVSSTNGAKGFKPEWVEHFHGFHVVLLYDSDPEGREAVQSLLLPAFKEAVEAGKVLSIKVIWLYEPWVDKAHKDLTDWVVTDGGSGARLKELIAQAAPHAYPTPTSHIEPPIELEKFSDIDQETYAGKRVTVPLQVFGENSEAYHAVIRFRVTYCLKLRDGKCMGPEGRDGACLKPIEIPWGSRAMLACVGCTDAQLKGLLRDYACDRDAKPSLEVLDHDRTTIREVYAHQSLDAMATDVVRLVEKPIYIIGGALVDIGKYQGTGRVVASYRGQRPTLIVDQLEKLEEDYQTFRLEQATASLRKLKELSPQEIAHDLALNVTRIYQRDDLHLGILLVMCSPLWINFPGDGKIRGWLSCILVGDTGTGKTTISQSLFNYAGVGDRVSGMTSSRTGITYGIDWDQVRGWRLKAGAFLKMTRQALIVDEAQDLDGNDLKTMAEGIDSGITKIDRIQNRVFESATRTVFGCNPKNLRQGWNLRTMDSFRYGCKAIKDIFPAMMIRRIDFALFAASWDIEDKSKIFFPEKSAQGPIVLAEDLRNLIYYAWNLEPKQVIISDEVAQYIRKNAKYLSDRFGGCDDLPIVYPEDFRKTMARLSVAYAVLDLATNEDFTQVIVEVWHVSDACSFLEDLYGKENCQLDMYAKSYLEAHGLGDFDKLKGEIDKILSKPHTQQTQRFRDIAGQLLNCNEGERVRKADLADAWKADKKTVQRAMQFFHKYHLVKPNISNGYSPEPKLFRVFNRLTQIDPEAYKFEPLAGTWEEGDEGEEE